MSDILKTKEEFTYDVILNYNVQDKTRVRHLAERLQAAGIRVWLDEWSIKPGEDNHMAMERGLNASRAMILCLSSVALGLGWVGLERSTIIFRDPSNVGRRFIPLLLSDCVLPDTLKSYKYIDYRQDDEAAFKELLSTCRVKRKLESKSGLGSLQPLPLPKEEHLIWAHKGLIRSIIVSPDGRWAVSGSDDMTIKIWELKTGNCRGILKRHTDPVNCVTFTPDGKRIISASSNSSILIWDANSGRELRRLEGHEREVYSIAALDDNGRALSGSCDTTLKLWDLETGGCLKTIETGEDVRSLAIRRGMNQALSGHGEGSIHIWDIKTGQCQSTLTGHYQCVNSIQVTPDGRYAVSGSNDKTVKIWDLETVTCVGTLEGHKEKVRSVAISTDGSLIASAGFKDGIVRLWNLTTGECVGTIKHNAVTISIAFSPLQLLVGTAKPDFIHIYRLADIKTALKIPSARRYVNAKVVLLGESGAGKTTLAHRLVEDRYIKTDSTHGMNVWRLDLPLLPDETTEREALLWDLAGQEDYRLIHQLYLEETALALLVVNPQKDDPFAEVGDWLKALRAVTARKGDQGVARLLIPTRMDVGGMKISQRKINEFLLEHSFAACLPTSAKRGDNCSDATSGGQQSKLKQHIVQNIPWDKLPWTSTPRLLADIKNAVVAMRDEADIRLLRFAELSQRLEQTLPKKKIDETDARTAVTLLANHGLVRPLKFGDLVLLRPELLNGYAGAIIRAARAHKDEIGCVTEEYVYSKDFDFTGVERLFRPDEELLLRALVQTLLDRALCIREVEDGKVLLIFPSQYRRDREIPGHPEVFVTYTFSGELQTIYTTLVVRLWYSRTFGRKELWRNAAEFTTSKGHTTGVVFEKLGEGEGKLSIFSETGVPDELKVVFIEFVHRHLLKYGRDLKRERRYVCTCGEPVTNPSMVQKRIQAGKDFIICQGCDQPVPFLDHIEERLGSDPVARKVVAMDERAKRELDSQALEQILTGHMQAICGEANQIFRELTKFDYGIDGEVEFKDNDGNPSGRKIYVQLKSGMSHLRMRKTDGREIYDVKNQRHLKYWVNQPVDVYLVIRDAQETIRWMNLTRYLNEREEKTSRQIVFDGEKLNAPAIWRTRDKVLSRAGLLRAMGD